MRCWTSCWFADLVAGWRFSSWEPQHWRAAHPTLPQLPASQGPDSLHHLSPFPQTPLASCGPELHLWIQAVEGKVLPISHLTHTSPGPTSAGAHTPACHPSQSPGPVFTPTESPVCPCSVTSAARPPPVLCPLPPGRLPKPCSPQPLLRTQARGRDSDFLLPPQ